MIIKSISLQNFLCYYGETNRFDFSEGLNIILGANGYGKSKLYDGFLWTITNQITDNDPNNRSGFKPTNLLRKDLISEKALIECSAGEYVECKVIIEVEQNNGKVYQLIRSYCSSKKNDGTWVEQKDSKFVIYFQDVIHFKPVPEADYNRILENLLPVDVRPYVWFQGERGINNLIDTSNDQSLKTVIRRLSDIDRWDKYINVVKKAYDTAQSAFDQALRNSRKNQDKIQAYQRDQQRLNSEISRLDTLIEETQKNLKAAQDKNEALSINFENAQNLDKLREQEESVSKEIKRIESDIDNFYLGFNKKLFTNSWILIGTEDLITKFEEKYQNFTDTVLERKAQENALKKIGDKMQSRLPEGVPEPMHINKMLEAQHCLVCDRPAPKDSPPYKAIEQLLAKEEAPKIKAKPNLDPLFRQLYHNTLALKENIVEAEDQIKESLQSLSALKAKKKIRDEELEAKSKEIQEQLRISGISNPKHIIDSVRITAADISRYSSELGRYETERDMKAKELRNVNSELGKLSEGEIPPYLTQKRDLLEDFAELTQRIKRKKYKELIQLLEDKANEHYRNINAPTGAFYGKIKFIESIDGGYRPSIIDPAKNDFDVTSSLNTSLISSMKLAIIMAIVSANNLRNYTSFYPLISDAPVSDFDVVKTKTFLKESASTFKQSIIIMKELLVEDENREARYIPDMERLSELKEDLDEMDKRITVYQIDMPDGVSNKFRNEIEIEIKPILN